MSDKKVQLIAKVRKDIKKKIQLMAVEQEVSVSQAISTLIENAGV